MNHSDIIEILEKNVHPLQAKLDAPLTQGLIHGFEIWYKSLKNKNIELKEFYQDITIYMLHTIKETRQLIEGLHLHNNKFQETFAKAVTNDEKRKYILDFVKDLGADSSCLRKDKQAFSRWFGADAALDRFNKKVTEHERKITFYFQKLVHISPLLFDRLSSNQDFQKLFKKLMIEKTAVMFFSYIGDTRVRISAFIYLARVLKSIAKKGISLPISEETLQYVYRAALDRNEDIWIQCEALELLENLSMSSLSDSINNRISQKAEGDDFFVRSRAVKIMAKHLNDLPKLDSLLTDIAKDPSPFVRQTLVDTLMQSDPEILKKWMPHLIQKDSVFQVRAYAINSIPFLLKNDDLIEFFANQLYASLKNETNSFVLRVCLKISYESLSKLTQNNQSICAKKWYGLLRPPIELLHQKSQDIAIRRWSAQTLEKMWSEIDPDACKLKKKLIPIINSLKKGQKKRLPRLITKNYQEQTLARVLSVLNQEGFPLEIDYGIFGVTLIKGHFFDFRMWRFLFEFFKPSPDKRQAFSHTIGRIFAGKIHIPSSIMSELTPTKVPGEPLFFPEESDWRPYLPLVDEILSSLFNTKPTKIYTSEGITQIIPPRFFISHIWAWLKISFNFAWYANLRNWESTGQKNASTYITALSSLGFTIDFNLYQSYSSENFTDMSVTQFFKIN